MKVHFEKGNATVPLWAVIVVVIGILTGGSGFVFGAVANGRDAEHRVLAAEIAEESKKVDSVIAANERQDMTDQQLREAVIRIEEQSKATLKAISKIEKKLGL